MLRLLGGILSALLITQSAYAQSQFLFMGTGSVTGIYYPTGNALCRILEQSDYGRQLTCSAESSGGSIDNIDALGRKELDLAIVQSDIQWRSFFGQAEFTNQGPNVELRSLFSLYPETFSLLVRSDSGIESLADLYGRSLNIGPEGSGQHATSLLMLDALNISSERFASLKQYKPDEQARALCNERVDGIVYVVGHPNTSLREATTMCETRLISLYDQQVNTIIDRFPFFTRASIPELIYANNANAVNTFGVAATMVTTAQLPEEQAYAFVAAIFEQLEYLKSLHPALGQLSATKMLEDGLSAPLHPGALRYYRERGWID
ncbi:TAXI family TRAP transporter solute-binding subunit [Alginatibacterium sediminis]|uniref:TAXI family TRAP transporter solute-binding subunit n=1 Tax=Alginatibacterium sediminis TaxID=2164068 RepID=A0A420EHU2_9ALTE|nr:TAXI family TRAP transporter solute-binding subunit [Alginatibacterium sediminis]RKF20265.1 TAXI family TRAP transporter solute-binding subunit [Alginatibacterium sediminis]